MPTTSKPSSSPLAVRSSESTASYRERTASTRTRSGRAVSDFTSLSATVHAAGLMRRRYGYYWTKLIASVGALTGWGVAFFLIGNTWWQLANAGFLALLLTQIAFLGHDAAHRQIFKSGKWNDWTSLIVANLLVGISHGWWKSKHNRHHAAPNKEGADPDLALRAIAMTSKNAARHTGPVKQWLVSRQGWFFFPILLLEGISLHASGLKLAFGPGKVERRWLELGLILTRIGGYIALVFVVLTPGKAVAFLAIQLGVFGLYLGACFAPNHIGMPLVPKSLKTDFLRRQVMVSRNISGGPVTSILMGGLNHQIEHHLFPSMPRPHLRRAAPLVKQHCLKLNVPYTSIGLGQSYQIVTRHLNAVGLKHQDPFLCPLVASRRLP